jgi:hypothetical protein
VKGQALIEKELEHVLLDGPLENGETPKLQMQILEGDPKFSV